LRMFGDDCKSTQKRSKATRKPKGNKRQKQKASTRRETDHNLILN